MATITFNAGTLPNGFCPTTWQQTFTGFVNALTGTVNGLNYSQIIVSTTAPNTDLTNLWLQVTNTGIPIQLYAYSVTAGSWEPVQQNWFFSGYTDTGAANAYVVTLSYLPISQTTGGIATSGLTTGMTLLFKATHANTGNSTFQVKVGASAYAAAPIKIIAAQIGAGYIVSNGWYLVQYDGTNFQLLNPDITAVVTPLIPPTPAIAFAVLESSPLIDLLAGVAPPQLLQTYNHGFGVVPAFVRPVMVCQADDASYLKDDEVDAFQFLTNNAAGIYISSAFSVRTTSVSVKTYQTFDTTGFPGSHKIYTYGDGFNAGTGNLPYLVTPANWKYKVYVAH
ncbi:MAG: hypothetical protein WCK04_02320 [Actinomycetes bacterium]